MKYYQTPPTRILCPSAAHGGGGLEIPAPDSLAAIMSAWGFPCRAVCVDTAPQLLTYHFDLENVRQRAKIKSLLPSLSALLHCPVTEANTARAHFALVMPRPVRVAVPFKSLLLDKVYNENTNPFAACLGYDTANNPVILDVTKAPHLLIAGATGSGKSVCLNTLLCALLYRATPNKLRFLMIDTKLLELTAYKGIPHLLAPIATDKTAAIAILRELTKLLRQRQQMLEGRGLRGIEGTEYPRIFLVIDELADFVLMAKDEINPLLIELAQLGRASGIHLILATQRPTVDVVTGLLKANIPCRIALQCSSIRDSMTILDHKGAEQLTGRGDALLKTADRVHERRLQVGFITPAEIDSVARWWRTNGIIEE